MRSIRSIGAPGIAALLLLFSQSLNSQQAGRSGSAATANPGTEWPMYRHDEAGTGYSPLTHIDQKNVASLTRVWTFSLQTTAPPSAEPARGRGGAGGGPNSEATPIVVN